MDVKSLRQKVEEFFCSAVETAASQPDLSDLLVSLNQSRSMIAQPMRVAFIGGVNNGKSTLMNAFLGESLAATGNRELTYNVSWFRYGERKQLLVHNMEGGIEEETFETLTDLTTRCEENRDLLDRVRYVEVRYPAKLLKEFDLIDTPGLYSAKKKDSENTKRFLLDRDTRPHAVVFVFSDTLKARDIAELEDFLKLNGSPITGITAIGALTKVDNLDAGLETAERVIDQIRKDHSWTLRSFYTIMPVMGQTGFGAQTLSLEDKETLQALAELPAARTNKLLLDAKTFGNKEYSDEPEIPCAANRLLLFERLGTHGIRHALKHLRNGQSLDEIRSSLLTGSNVDKLRHLVVSHFGNRAFLIKSHSALDAIREQAFYLGERLRGSAQTAVYSIVNAVDRIKVEEPRFREFGVLNKYYSGTLDLDECDLRQLVNVTGEMGMSCRCRLGVNDDTPLHELIALAARREAQWHSRSTEYWSSEETKEMARVLAQSYGEIHGRLLEADGHIRTAAALIAYEL